MNRAVFLDRDGVINPNVFNPSTEEWESPHREEDFEIYPWVLETLKRLKPHFLLYLVSNQPSYAKGKTSLENIKNIHKKFEAILKKNQLCFEEYYYCYHHPDGVVQEYSGSCPCRKPSPYFLEEARKKYQLEMKASWMIGDRMTDMECGKAAGVKTIFINSDINQHIEAVKADFVATNLLEAAKIIMKNNL